VQYRTLGKTDLEVSEIGFGASPLGSVFEEVRPEECVRTVHLAIDRGITYFDVSPYYGIRLAEERLGQALAGRRKEVILATKCGRYGRREFDFSAGRVKKSIDESLHRLQTDYVDLLQVHDIEFGKADQIVEETLPALREIRDSGKCRFIGITGYSLKLLLEVAARSPVDTVLSYCHYNLLMDDMEAELTPFCQERGLGLINSSPLHMGMLAERELPDWHPAPMEVREAGRRVVEACRTAGLDGAAVALRYCLDHPYVSTTLIGMAHEREVETSLSALNVRIPAELRQEIERIVAPVKNTVWASG
jgi:L-galactose dehydrogenase